MAYRQRSSLLSHAVWTISCCYVCVVTDVLSIEDWNITDPNYADSIKLDSSVHVIFTPTYCVEYDCTFIESLYIEQPSVLRNSK